MRHGGGFRLIGALLVVGVVAALTAGAYSAGFVAGAGSGATNASPWVYGGAFGASGIVGLIVTVLVLVVVFRVLRFAFWGHSRAAWERGGPGRPGGPGDDGWNRHDEHWHGGPWGGGPWHSARRAAFDEMHRRAHGEQPGQPPAAGNASGGEQPR